MALRNTACTLRALAARLVSDRRGSIAIFIAAAAVPLIGALGLATDTARGYLVKSRLAQALDAAALMGGKDIDSPTRDADVQRFFSANFPAGYMDATLTPLVITPSANNTVLTVSATATVPTTFMRVLGFEEITVAEETEVENSISPALDVVLSIDVSGSMGQPYSKIEAARTAASNLVDVLYGAATTSPTYTVDGVTYNLVNIGLVPWNSKVNITQRNVVTGLMPTYSTASTVQTTVPAYTSPITGQASLTTVTYPNSSPSVPLYTLPFTEPASNWEGCVYARYIGDSSNTNDGDLNLTLGTIGGQAWVAFEHIPTYEGEPRSGTWSSTEGPSGTMWRDDSDYSDRACYQAYWNDSIADGDNSGYTRSHPIGTTSGGAAAGQVMDAPNYTGTTYDWHPATPRINAGGDYDNIDCAACPNFGITPLQPSKSIIQDAIDELEPSGTTNIPQGLFWAAQVLMPGNPFPEAYASVPFARNQAIVLLTDGQIHGSNGDAYKGRFGSGNNAGSVYNSAHGLLPSGAQNTLNNRLLQLATNLKALGIKIYVIQFDETSTTLTTLLKAVATDDVSPYYFNAPTEADLEDAFDEIAGDLARLRISK